MLPLQFARPALIVPFLFSVIACTPRSESQQQKVGRFEIRTEASDGTFSIHDGERVLLRSSSTPAVAIEHRAHATMQFGRFTFQQNVTSETNLRGVTLRNGKLSINGAKLTLTPVDQGDILRLDLQSDITGLGAVRLQFDCSAHDNFMGFGEQYSFIAMKGKRVPIWVEENGLGRTDNPQTLPWQGTQFSSYFPMPYFLDPRGMGFVSDSPAHQVFSLCENGSKTWSVEVWDNRPFSLYILAGPQPMDVVSQLTTITGRPRQLPDWGFDLWLSAQGGEANVRHVMNLADEAGIPWSAVWVQDWVGKREFSSGLFGVKYRWKLDETYYPNMATLITDIHADGKKFLGYFNPFIPPDYDFYDEAAEKGYLIQTAAGEPYLFTISVFDSSLVDLTNPDAVKWFQGYARTAIEQGQDGWMADFGEWLPWDAVIHEGTPATVHNQYPTLWHKASREVLDEMRPDGDYILLTRSGHLHEAGVAQVVWAGDQEADWDEHDGFPTAVRAIVSLSLSGIPYVTHDVAGFSGGPSDKELWQRWVEFGAFTPIMRLHDGLKKLENWYFYSDAASKAHLARFSTIHSKLKPYLKQLAQEAVTQGHPIVRHYVLVDGRKETRLIEDAYFLGNDLLVAPIVVQGATTRTVVFPQGEWRAVFGTGVVTGPLEQQVNAPIGSPAVYARVGSDVDHLLKDLP